MGKCTWKHQHLHLVSGVNISMMRNLEPYTAVTQDKIQLPWEMHTPKQLEINVTKQSYIIVTESPENWETDYTKRKKNSIRDVKYIYGQFI